MEFIIDKYCRHLSNCHVIAGDQSVTRIEVSPPTGFGRDYVRGHDLNFSEF